MKKRVISLLLTICLSCCLLAAGGWQTSAAPLRYGLTLDAQGNFVLNGQKFYGYGVNAAAGDVWHDPFDDTYRVCLETLEKFGIPFTRTIITYGSIEDYKRYLEDPDAYFAASQQMLDMAAEAHIGVIVTVISSCRYTSLLGEKPSAVGDINSKSMAFQKKWTKDMVERFVNHPAVWGWEIGNERNLESDLMFTEHDGQLNMVYGDLVGEFNGYDSVTAEEFAVMKREIAKSIREVDPYRIISSGDAIMRESAYHLHQASQKMNSNHEWTVDWTRDTLEQWRYMNLYATPDPVNAISTHFAMTYDDFGYALQDTTLNLEQLLKEYVTQAKAAKKGFYFGEFGDLGDADIDPAQGKELAVKNLNAMVNAGVQLASLWQRNKNNSVVTDEGNLAVTIREIQKINQKFQSAGLQNTEKYWAAADNAASSKPTDPVKPTNPVTPTSPSAIEPGSSTVSTSPAGEDEVSQYMLSQSTKLSISGTDNRITIQKPVSLDIFQRSIALREGYTLSVADGSGSILTSADAQVDGSCTVTVRDPEGVTVRQFTVAVAQPASNTTAPASTSSAGEQNAGGSGWWIWLIVVLVIVVLAGGAAAFYFLYLRKKLALRKEENKK